MWPRKRLKFATVLINRGMAPAYVVEDGIPVINQSCVQKSGVNWEKIKFHDASAPLNLGAVLQNGDLLINSTGTGTLGRVCLFQHRFPSAAEQVIADGHVTIVRVDTSQLLPRFLFYLFCEKQEEITVFGSEGSTNQIELSRARMGTYVVPVPSLDEQQRIVTYLDNETARLDELRAEKEKFLELLERKRAALIAHAVTGRLYLIKARNDQAARFKPSGIEWLGDVPEHWKVKKLAYIAQLRSGEGITSESIEETGAYPVFGGNGLRGYTSDFTHDGHYVLIGRQGALCGNVNYASGKFWASEHAVVVTPLTEFDVVWLGELLRVMNLSQYSVAAAQPGLSVESISSLKIPVPPLDEQRAIVAYLERALSEMDELKATLLDSLGLLAQRRAALIAEAVTGRLKQTTRPT